jgi:predicted RNA-binding protein associated with RNAse of E/G family
MPENVQLEDVHLPEGSISVGYFWVHKPFNTYHWVDASQRSLALYFNICDSVSISREQIAWRDLTVDVLITPDTRCRVLDEDELPDGLDPELRASIAATSAELCANSTHLLAAFEARSRKLLREA